MLDAVDRPNTENIKTMPDLTALTLAEAAAQMRAGQLSPIALTEAHLVRIAALNPTINAYLTVTAEQALQAARAAESALQGGEYWGPLHGIPIAYKDLFDTAGVHTTNGTQFWRDRVPAADAEVVARLHRAGAVMLGKLNMHEIALGVLSDNPHYGPVRNPYNTAYAPGGSSGGSGAALAARLCMGALGSDTRGSIRIPAALCGVVGLKPTYGRISLRGVLPLCPPLDHPGPMARTVEDVALLYMAMAGHDPADPFSVDRPMEDVFSGLKDGIAGWRVGVVEDAYFGMAAPEVQEAYSNAIDVLCALGADVIRVEMAAIGELARQSRLMVSADAANLYREQLSREPGSFGADVLARLTGDADGSAADYARARHAQALVRHQIGGILADLDVLVTPTTPLAAVRLDDPDQVAEGRAKLSLFTGMFNLAGVPALSLPCSFTDEGLPIGLQMVGKHWQEGPLLRAAYAYERATEWYTREPNL